jgi:drug/metabolite transporter superfamily protein YnfA
MWAAILVVLTIVGALKLTWKRANTGARLAAIGGFFLVLWLAVALVSVSDAAKVSAWTAGGLVTTIHGLAAFIGQI